jgi:hypothetical protein
VLLFIEEPEGVRLMNRDDLERQVLAEMAGGDLVDQLLAERRAEALGDAAE